MLRLDNLSRVDAAVGSRREREKAQLLEMHPR